MKKCVHNFGRSVVKTASPFLIPISIGPILLAGVTFVPAARGTELMFDLNRTRDQVEQLEERKDALLRFGSEEGIREVNLLRETLRQILPHELSDIEVFQGIRLAAERHGLSIDSIRIGATSDMGWVVQGETVVMRDVAIRAQGGLDGFIAMLDELRAAGFPHAALRFMVHRDFPADEVFMIDVNLGLFHYALSQPEPTEGE